MEGFGENFFPVSIAEPARTVPGALAQLLLLMAIRMSQVLAYAFAITLGVLLAFRVAG